MHKPLLMLLVLEAAYIFCTRILPHSVDEHLVAEELVKTIFRANSLIVLLMVYRKYCVNQECVGMWTWTYALPIILLMAAPFLMGNWNLPSEARHVFAATSFVVGFREEIAYRGILQRILAGRLGFWPALALSNLAFLLYHYGAQPFTFWSVAQFTSLGIALGLIFHLSGSLILVGILHSVYDLIYCYSPWVDSPVHLSLGVSIIWIGIVILIHGTLRKNERNRLISQTLKTISKN